MRQLALTTTGEWRAGATCDRTRARRFAATLGAVIALHAGLLAWVLMPRERTVEREVEAPAIVAALLSETPDAPAAVPHAQTHASAAPSALPVPVPVPAPPHNQAASHPKPSRNNAPAHVPPAPAPSATPATALQPSAAVQTAPAAPATPPANTTASTAAPAEARQAPASSEPKTVSHVDCAIPAPDYPDVSKRRGESGTALVRFVVGLSGRIESVQLQKSSGYARLDEAALAAIHAGTCQTYRENGEPVRAAYSQSFVFGLSD